MDFHHKELKKLEKQYSHAVKSVPGVLVQGGKYVYVRGLGDIYKSILNGVDIPGLDPTEIPFKWIYSQLIF